MQRTPPVKNGWDVRLPNSHRPARRRPRLNRLRGLFGFMLATSNSVTASGATSSTRARIAAISSKLKLTSSPPDSDESNRPNVGRLNSASPVVSSFSRISR
jgi:hypothetical protein